MCIMTVKGLFAYAATCVLSCRSAMHGPPACGLTLHAMLARLTVYMVPRVVNPTSLISGVQMGEPPLATAHGRSISGNLCE